MRAGGGELAPVQDGHHQDKICDATPALAPTKSFVRERRLEGAAPSDPCSPRAGRPGRRPQRRTLAAQ